MKRAWNRTPRGKSTARESRAFAIVVLATAAPVLGTIMIVVSSTKPNLSYRTFPPAADDDILTLDWPTLYKLEDECRKSAAVPPAYVEPAVRLPGYMLPPHQPGASRAEVTAFLLVPDPGHWLHSAHEDDGVLVRMHAGGKTLLRPRQVVWVQGRLSISPTQERGEAPCLIEASTVYEGPIP
jgi:hypothetical protein